VAAAFLDRRARDRRTAEHPMRYTWLLALAALLAAGPVEAQISVTPIRNLAFGPVIVGVPTSIGPSHPVRSGQFRLVAPLLARVRFRFTLPNRLNGPAGATLPISFSNTDAIAMGTGPTSVPVTFDPKVQQTFQIVTSTTINVFIGGTVSPAANQRQGNYSGTITFTVTVL
jgi:hypothetical protein